MKKKLLVSVIAIVMVLTCALGLVACGGFKEGTYTMYMTQGKNAVALGEYEFADGNIKAAGIKVGTYKVDGDDVTVTIAEQSAKYVKSGDMWKYTEDGHTALMVKKGEKPDGYTVVDEDTLGGLVGGLFG